MRQRFLVAVGETVHGPAFFEQAILPDLDLAWIQRAMTKEISQIDPLFEGISFTEVEKYTQLVYL